MNSISEARELRKRINGAYNCIIGVGADYHFIMMSTPELQDFIDMLKTMLLMTCREVDALIDEWDAEKGIDRPL
jgi:hypothetical protein